MWRRRCAGSMSSLLGLVGGSHCITCKPFYSCYSAGERSDKSKKMIDQNLRFPVVLSTWDFGLDANTVAWNVLNSSGSALDAVEKGVRYTESDPTERSVGFGGRPDREGRVTLDACIMDHQFNIGSVACMENICHAISVARSVMEKSPHALLVGEGALQFALKQGFKKENLLTSQSAKEWREWLVHSEYKPIANIENHDTIGMIALDSHGNLAGACTTSGMAFKLHGRVGDSPIAGAGVYVDNSVGAAVATGHGEEVMRCLGSFLVVELMRRGLSPQCACEEAVHRVVAISKVRKNDLKNIQVGFLALNDKGEYGAFSLQTGFTFAVCDPKNGNRLLNSDGFIVPETIHEFAKLSK